MEEILRKMNLVKRYNETFLLKRELEENKLKMKQIEENSREIIRMHSEETEKLFQDLNNKIKELEDENLSLKKNVEFYKNTLDSLPKFIVKLFSKKSLKLNQGEK